MKYSMIVLSVMLLIPAGFAYTGNPVLVEMPMTENWSALPDTRDINVIWFSDDTAILAVTSEGLALLDNHSIKFDTLGEMLPDRHYYIVGARENAIRETWSGVQLVTGHYLVNVSTDTVMPYRRDMYYQRLWPSRRTISALIPPVYERYGSREYNPIIQGFVDQVSETTIYDLLVQMVSYNTRYSYAPELLDAVDWAKSELESWGYDVFLRPHTSEMAPNVIAWKHGLLNPDRIWVVGGHFDSISGQPNTLAPGANDNGTGSALTMHAADILKDVSFADTVIYALWTGEEQGLHGSAHWAAWAAGEGLDIQGYYNFDMIGWEDPAPEDLDVLVNNASFDFGQDFVDVTDMYTDLLHDLQVANVTASDHYSFWQNGYVAFCGIEDYWPGYPYYHTVNDTVDKVSIPFTAEVTKAMVANVCVAAQLVETVSIRQPKVSCNTLMDVFVVDFDASGSVVVDVYSDTEPTPETILLNETAANMFEGSVQVTDAPPVPDDNQISVTHGDTITVYYSNIDEAAHVDVDCIPPVVSNINVTDLTSRSAIITFETDELATVLVRYGTTTPDMVAEENRTDTNHAVVLSDLDECTMYVFEIEATDMAGNFIVDDAGGVYYHFVTMELNTLMEADMDTDPGWTYENLWEWGPASGVSGNPPSGYTGTHIVGYNLTGNYQNSLPETNTTTQPIDCSDASAVYLSFWRWLGVESSTWDHASIKISNNSGSTWHTVWQYSGGTLQETSWSYQEYDISDWAAGQSDVRLRWVMGPTDSIIAYCGWNIDDVLVFEEKPCDIPTPTPSTPTPTPTPDCINHGDINFDGVISAADAQLAFLIAIGAYAPSYEEECAADCNGDGIVTAADAQLIFLTAIGSATCVDPL
jgi:hypothetical protein